LEDHNEMKLSSYIQKNSSDLWFFLYVALELVDWIRQLHSSGVVLHNVNPDNISIQSKDRRLALKLISESSSHRIDVRTLEQNEDLIKVFAYMSPEQTGRMKWKIDQRSDLYALGVIFYELLTGELPFKANTANEWIHAHMALLPLPPSVVKQGIPPMLSEIIMKLLSKTAGRRYQSAYGLLDDLRNCSDQLKRNGMIEPFSLGIIDKLSRFRLPDKLYGREREQQELQDAYERTCSGSKEILFIGGHAGSGKTTLVQAVQTSVMHNKGYFISGKFDPLHSSIPYASLIAAFRDLIRKILTEDEDHIFLWRQKIIEAIGQRGIVLIEVIAELALIIGEQPQVEALPPVEATNRFQTLFCNFIKVFANKDHPLVIWLDNLQGADSASIDLLRVLMIDPSNKYLCLIGTFRNHEVDEEHEIAGMFSDLSPIRDKSIRSINLEGLGYLNVIQYVADALHADQSRITPLAKILYQKTAGNPFYLKQMLQIFYEKKLIYFDLDQKRWEWHIQEISECDGFQDVSSLIVGRLDTLPYETREVLHLAGCIGNSFEIHMLSMLCGQETEQTEQDLVPALSAGLVLIEKDRYVFLHDQVQRVAYDHIPKEEKTQVHLKIGRLMLCYFQSEPWDKHLFEIVHHLNLGSELMTDPAEIERLAELCLRAGRKAKASAAYVQALELLEKGSQLIAPEGWSQHFDLYTKLLIECSECQYFCGYFEQAETVLEQLLLHVNDVLDRAKIYVIQITMYAFQKKVGQASDVALKAMAEFGLHTPSKYTCLSIMREIVYTQVMLAGKRSHLKDLPLSQDPLHKALAEIVMVSSSSLFVANDELAVILFARYVRMSLDQGHAEALAIALGSYAITLAFGFKSYGTAFRLAEIALHYSEKTDSLLLQGKIQVIVGLILQFVRPQESGSYFQKAGQLSLEGGDVLYAGHALSCQLIAGSKDLRHLDHICKSNAEKSARALDKLTLRVLNQTMQYVDLLQNTTNSNHLCFNKGYFDESQLKQEEFLFAQYNVNLYYYYTCKLEVSYLYGYYSEALAIAEQSKDLEAAVLVPIKQKHCFYYALSIIAIYPSATHRMKYHYRKILNQLLARMKQWTKLVPESTLSRYWTMLAELAILDQEFAKAATMYDQAIQWAQKNECPQDEAIVNERVAHYYLQLDNHNRAEFYLQDACKAYYKWGAFGKVKSLQDRNPSLMTLIFNEMDPSDDRGDHAVKETAADDKRANNVLNSELDMDTLRQASKIVSKGKAEKELLNDFLNLAIYNVGAERGCIILGSEGMWTVEAEKESNHNKESPGDTRAHFSTSVAQFVMRTRESLILGDARQSIFVTDPYIRGNQPKSILCLPFRYTDHRDGILYMENNLTSDAFTADRLEVLEMIFSRMSYLRINSVEDVKSVEIKVSSTLVESLSDREIEILRLMAEGLSNKEVAVQLEITEGTVKSHAFNIYGKLEVNRRVQAISKARELQLLN
jgi:predicted ATPase/DNA-binding CsgD family transcriptional regulator